jgi:hypothetical protein
MDWNTLKTSIPTRVYFPSVETVRLQSALTVSHIYRYTYISRIRLTTARSAGKLSGRLVIPDLA